MCHRPRPHILVLWRAPPSADDHPAAERSTRVDPLSSAVEWAEELTWGVVRLSRALDAAGRAALLLELATAVEEGAVRAPLAGPEAGVTARQEQVSLRLVIDAATEHAVTVGGLTVQDASAADHWRLTDLPTVTESPAPPA